VTRVNGRSPQNAQAGATAVLGTARPQPQGPNPLQAIALALDSLAGAISDARHVCAACLTERESDDAPVAYAVTTVDGTDTCVKHVEAARDDRPRP
jgi:hypothetical protein